MIEKLLGDLYWTELPEKMDLFADTYIKSKNDLYSLVVSKKKDVYICFLNHHREKFFNFKVFKKSPEFLNPGEQNVFSREGFIKELKSQAVLTSIKNEIIIGICDATLGYITKSKNGHINYFYNSPNINQTEVRVEIYNKWRPVLNVEEVFEEFLKVSKECAERSFEQS